MSATTSTATPHPINTSLAHYHPQRGHRQDVTEPTEPDVSVRGHIFSTRTSTT